jgi:hypothetical protein
MKLLKSLTIIALVCYGQSVLAMNQGWQAQIKRQVADMNDQAVVARLQNLNGITLQEQAGDYRIYDSNDLFLCLPKVYLTLLLQLQALSNNNGAAFEEIMNFVFANPNNQIPAPLINAVIGNQQALNQGNQSLSALIIRNIIENGNVVMPEPLQQ